VICYNQLISWTIMCENGDDEQRELMEAFMLQQELESMAVAYLNQDREEQEEEEESLKQRELEKAGKAPDQKPKAKKDAEEESKAKGRWKLLSCNILQIPLNDKASDAFKFPSFDLFDVTALPPAAAASAAPALPAPTTTDAAASEISTSTEEKQQREERNWCSIRVKSVPGLLFKICTVKPVFSHKELHGYNNTGNTQIWASEECTSIFCLDNPDLFRGKTVVELGAGMTGLAGLIVAAECHPDKVVLTDGNEKSVDNLRNIIQNNPFYCGDGEKVTAGVLRWDQDPGSELRGSADVVLCSDCLFFDEGRAPLLQCLKQLLTTDGVVVMIQPRRRGTMQKFIDLVVKDGYFRHELSEKISDSIQEILETKIATDKMYEADIHRSLLLTLRPAASKPST